MDNQDTMFPNLSLTRICGWRLVAGLALLLPLLLASWWLPGMARAVLLFTLGGMACYCLGRYQGGFTEPLLFALSPLPMLVWDRDRHRLLAANEAALALTGYNRDTLAGLPLEQLLPAARQRLRMAGGAERDVRVAVRKTRWKNVPALLLVIQDARQPVIAPEYYAHLFKMLESVAEALVTLDEQGRVLYVNAQAERFFQCGREALAGHVLWQRLPFLQGSLLQARLGDMQRCGQRLDFEEFYPALGKWFEVHLYPSAGQPAVYFRDITSHKLADGQLRAAEERFWQMFEANPVPMWVMDARRQRMLAVNQAALSDYGYSREEFLSQHMQDIGLPEEVSSLCGATPAQTGMEGVGEWTHRKKDGTHIVADVYMQQLLYGGAPAILVLALDRTQRRQHEAELARRAAHDTLTGLPKRMLLIREAEKAIQRARADGSRVALLLIDLDRFKHINESLGHPAGDEVLRTLALRLQAAAPAGTMLARLGSDEFILLLPEVRQHEAVAALAEVIRGAVGRPLCLSGREVFLTATLGISVHPEDGGHGDELLKNASLALYEAKKLGGNGWQFYQPPMQAAACARIDLECSLYKALEQQQFTLLYQPRVNAATGKLDCVEALVRWQAPGVGMLAPDRFVSVLEETGLIVPVGQWVLRTACSQAEAWRRQDGVELKVAVNISARQLRQPDFVAMVAGILKESGIAPQRLELELTESVLLQQNVATQQAMAQLKALGVQLAVDDFGTGYSALNYLKHFPIDSLKIDKSFVQDIHQGTREAELAGAIISMGHSLKLKVVAEGVESKAQLDFLRERHCDEIQGFYTGKPMRAEEILDLIGRQPYLPGLEPAVLQAAVADGGTAAVDGREVAHADPDPKR